MSKCCPSEASRRLGGYLLIGAAALCWGVSACLGRAVFTGKLFGGDVHPIQPLILAQSRTTLSLLVLAPVLLGRGGAKALKMSLKDLGLCLALGIFGVAGSNYCYYLSIQRTNVATAIILQYTAPIFVLLYMVFRGLQRPTLRRVGTVALGVAGAGLAIGIVGVEPVRLDTLGVVAAFAAAVSFAYYNVAGGELVGRHDRWSVLLWALFGAAAFWQFVNPPWKIMATHYSPGQWGFMGVFAVASVLLPFSLYFAGLQRLDPTSAIVGSCLEPVFSIIIAAAALGETMGTLQVAGIIAVLAAIVLAQLPERSRGQAEDGAVMQAAD